jgi:hypothetical protein
MNEAFDASLSVITDEAVTKNTKKLQSFNLIDIGTISSVTPDGRCSVDSFKFVNGVNIKYTSLELIFPGGLGTLNPSGMFGLVLFPAPITDLSQNAVTETKDYFSASGGKVIPIGLYNEESLKTGFDNSGNLCIYGDKLSMKIDDQSVRVDVNADTGNAMSIFADTNGVNISMCNGSILYQSSIVDGSEIIAHAANNKPFYFDKKVGEEHWIGHASYKTFQQRSFDLANFVKTDFVFVEDFLLTERWLYIYADDGSAVASLCIDNTGEMLIETAEDITVDRDGTKLEVKNGKVVVTGDLEVSGKTTITGMKTDVQKFFDDLTDALSRMYTLGSPATHNTDGGFKSNIALLRSKL